MLMGQAQELGSYLEQRGPEADRGGTKTTLGKSAERSCQASQVVTRSNNASTAHGLVRYFSQKFSERGRSGLAGFLQICQRYNAGRETTRPFSTPLFASSSCPAAPLDSIPASRSRVFPAELAASAGYALDRLYERWSPGHIRASRIHRVPIAGRSLSLYRVADAPLAERIPRSQIAGARLGSPCGGKPRHLHDRRAAA